LPTPREQLLNPCHSAFRQHHRHRSLLHHEEYT
jgi:hypothetical protein